MQRKPEDVKYLFLYIKSTQSYNTISMKFKLKSNFNPTPDQEQAIDKLVGGIKSSLKYQVLLGVTGSGKTFTMANVIEKLQRPTLIISHNKTLAAQLYQEYRDFFPENAVSFFVSYYDYYQPEAYIASTDTYIEKDADINELIDKLRLSATTNLLTRPDTIVVASVSCIYNLGSPREYGHFVLELGVGMKTTREQIIDRLIDLQYERSDFGFHRGTFRVRGDTIDVYPAYQDEAIRIELVGKSIKSVNQINPLTGSPVSSIQYPVSNFVLYPAKHYITDRTRHKKVFANIREDLSYRVFRLKKEGKELEAHRLSQKVNYDLEMIEEVGYVKGIENYSRYFDGRSPGEPPYTLLDYFREPYNDNWLVIVDESHMTFPQIRGMYAGDFSRKQTLIDYGFRLPSALDNRPLKFDEFMRRIPNFIATSATPAEWEVSMSKPDYRLLTTDYRNKQAVDHSLSTDYRLPTTVKNEKAVDGVVQQLVRPTGIADPLVEIRPTGNQVANVIEEIRKEAKKGRRTLVTTLTKRTAEDLASYLAEKGLKVHYLHSDIKTLDRTDILDDLRGGMYDVLVGINLLREGLDIPEVALVAILDSDKEGFLRSDVTLIQTMGRAARHVDGRVIMYADRITASMRKALSEVERRRKYQISYNERYKIKPKSIEKPIRERLVAKEEDKRFPESLPHVDVDSLTPMEKRKLVTNLKKEMRLSAEDLNFELAAEIRDKIKEISTGL